MMWAFENRTGILLGLWDLTDLEERKGQQNKRQGDKTLLGLQRSQQRVACSLD